MISRFALLIFYFISSTSSQSSTINKACSVGDSMCDTGQVCVNNRCECDPVQRRFWAGDKLQCRVCPLNYNRLPDRCYKYYIPYKNQSAARADCRKDQAELFSWRDNSDENEIINALTIANKDLTAYQLYSWSSGIVHHGSIADYKVTWFDPKAPTIGYPNLKDPASTRFCNELMMSKYQGYYEPTRLTKNGETEDCVSLVFVPHANARGQICMADDYCSTQMSYLCELTETTISGALRPMTSPSPSKSTNPSNEVVPNPPQPDSINNEDQGEENTPAPLADSDSLNTSSILMYTVGLIVFFVVFGVISFIVIRKRKEKTETAQPTSETSVTSSTMSEGEISQNP